MFQFTMPKTHPHKQAIMPLMRFVGGLPMITLRPHEGGRLKVMREGEWIGTVIPQFLDSGEEWGTGGEPYELLSHPDSEFTYRGSAGHMAQVLSLLQQQNGDWEKVADMY